MVPLVGAFLPFTNGTIIRHDVMNLSMKLILMFYRLALLLAIGFF